MDEMATATRLVLMGAVLLTLVGSNVLGQTGEARGKFSVGLHAGMFLPMGAWTEHRFAPGVNQFQKGIYGGGILEMELGSRVGLGLEFGYEKLDVGDWVDYAALKGDRISASAEMGHIGILLRPYLLKRTRDLLKLDFGFALVFPSGQETYAPTTYTYDFMKANIGFVTGLEFDHFVSARMAIAGRLNVIMVSSGIKYADGVSHAIYGLPVSVGIRYYP
jgi:hypothetical protein